MVNHTLGSERERVRESERARDGKRQGRALDIFSLPDEREEQGGGPRRFVVLLHLAGTWPNGGHSTRRALSPADPVVKISRSARALPAARTVAASDK